MQCMEVWGGNHAFDNKVAMPGLDVWVLSVPHEGSDSGGDIHYVSSCATGRIARFVVADVSGHGPQVSDVAVRLRGLMRRFVNHVDQSRVVQRVNESFAEQPGDDAYFATAILGTYWAPTSFLTLCNAGHPRPILYRAATGTWDLVTTHVPQSGLANIPLGIDAGVRYDQASLTLEKGDLVLVYTDSLIEAKGHDGSRVGELGLLEMLRKVDVSRPDGVVRSLLSRVESFRGGVPSDDDVTVLLLRHTGERPRATFATFLRALRGFGQAIGDRFRGRARQFPWPEISLATIGGVLISALNRRIGSRRG